MKHSKRYVKIRILTEMVEAIDAVKGKQAQEYVAATAENRKKYVERLKNLGVDIQ